jgi:hypothetical protein
MDIPILRGIVKSSVLELDGCVNEYGVEVDVCSGGGPNAGGVTIQLRIPDRDEISIRLQNDGIFTVVEL